jgi:hypothetical protein
MTHPSILLIWCFPLSLYRMNSSRRYSGGGGNQVRLVAYGRIQCDIRFMHWTQIMINFGAVSAPLISGNLYTFGELNCWVGIATRLWAGWPRNQGSIPAMRRDFSLLCNVHTSHGVHTAFYIMCSGTCIHLPPSNAKVRNGGTILQYPLHLHHVVLN